MECFRWFHKWNFWHFFSHQEFELQKKENKNRFEIWNVSIIKNILNFKIHHNFLIQKWIYFFKCILLSWRFTTHFNFPAMNTTENPPILLSIFNFLFFHNFFHILFIIFLEEFQLGSGPNWFLYIFTSFFMEKHYQIRKIQSFSFKFYFKKL